MGCAMDYKCRIVSDGTPNGTKIFGSDGKAVALPISAIDISFRPGRAVVATISLAATQVDIVASDMVFESKSHG